MPNTVSSVVLSKAVAGPPGTNYIKLEEVLVHGSGTLTELVIGGQTTFELELTKGKLEEGEGLQLKESLSVRGVINGANFMLPGQLQVTHAKKPWKLSGKIGNPG